MPDLVNPKEHVAVARLLEFLVEQKPWNRSLWGVGIVLAMDELYEACIAMRHGYLSKGALTRMTSSLQKRVGRHPAFTDEERNFLRQLIQQIPRPDGLTHIGIRELASRISTNYLTRWGTAIAAQNFTVEHFARSVAAHMLDAGFSGQFLHDLIKARLSAPEPITLQQLCELLQAEMAASPRREFDVLLAFDSVPDLPSLPPSWIKGPAVTAWLRKHGFDTAGVRSPVAMVLKVHARDATGAAHAARSESDRYAARALLATGKRLDRTPMMWVIGSSGPALMKQHSRGVEVKELYRADRIFSTEMGQSIDAALELLAHLEESSPPAAVAGGWGAIEGLLADPSDRASAADNLATLVTCSFPRAELTGLSYRVEREHRGQFPELEAATTNRERSRVVAQMIVDRRLPPMFRLTDQAAVDRLQRLLRNPHAELQAIRDAIGESCHRLYRQRNLILHGARLDSVALTASLRTVAKLVGAGMDRITHGHYIQHLRPLELVAKANLGLALLSRDAPLACVDLLELG